MLRNKIMREIPKIDNNRMLIESYERLEQWAEEANAELRSKAKENEKLQNVVDAMKLVNSIASWYEMVFDEVPPEYKKKSFKERIDEALKEERNEIDTNIKRL